LAAGGEFSHQAVDLTSHGSTLPPQAFGTNGATEAVCNTTAIKCHLSWLTDGRSTQSSTADVESVREVEEETDLGTEGLDGVGRAFKENCEIGDARRLTAACNA